MEVVKAVLAEDGYNLEIKEFSDYVQPNMALAEGQLDANFFQHQPYLDNMNKEKKLGLVSVAKVHVEPLGLYSNKITLADTEPNNYPAKLELLKPQLKKGAKISVPNDPTNGARALRLLEANGIIKLKAGELVTAKDITENPYELNIVGLDALNCHAPWMMLPLRLLTATLLAKLALIPARDAIVIEGKDSPYANVIAVRESEKDSAKIKALVKTKIPPKVKAYIEEELAPKGILPSF